MQVLFCRPGKENGQINAFLLRLRLSAEGQDAGKAAAKNRRLMGKEDQRRRMNLLGVAPDMDLALPEKMDDPLGKARNRRAED